MLKINLGSGYKRYEGFVNVDGDKNCYPDYLVNLEKDNLPFEDNSVSEVKAHHILEHIGEGYFHLLQEIYRVCENGAIIDIEVPHPLHETFMNDPTHKRPIMVEGMRLFSKKFNQHEIDTMGKSSTLGLMYDVDFELVDFKFVPDPFYYDLIQRQTEEENMRFFREHVNVCILILIKLVVVK